MCIDAGVRAAADFGFSVVVVHDACATKAQEFNGVKVGAEEVHATFMASLKDKNLMVRVGGVCLCEGGEDRRSFGGDERNDERNNYNFFFCLICCYCNLLCSCAVQKKKV